MRKNVRRTIFSSPGWRDSVQAGAILPATMTLGVGEKNDGKTKKKGAQRERKSLWARNGKTFFLGGVDKGEQAA